MASANLQNARKIWLDGLRGLALLFVIIGHVNPGSSFFIFTSPIKIPLFFAISGYLFRDRDGDQKVFYIHLIRHLVIPWLILGMIVKIPAALINGPQVLLERFLVLITGEEVWYMPCCIIAMILHFYIRKFCKNTLAVAVACAACFAIGLLLGRMNILDIAMINCAFAVQMYLLIGYLFRLLENRPFLSGGKPVLLGISAYAALCCINLVLFPGQGLNVPTHHYFNLPFCILQIYIGCTAALAAGKWIGRVPRLLSFIGQNSLVIYILEAYPRVLLRRVLSLMGLALPDGWIGKLILICASVIGCCIAALIIDRFLPELAGKRRKK